MIAPRVGRASTARNPTGARLPPEAGHPGLGLNLRDGDRVEISPDPTEAVPARVSLDRTSCSAFLHDVRSLATRGSQKCVEVAAGETTEGSLETSTIYPGIARRFWVHVPARYEPGVPACLAVFQDSWWYLDPGGQIRGAVVLDNLIDRQQIPVTIGVFVDPGTAPDAQERKQRNLEYDAFDDRYVSLVAEEILPWIDARWSISTAPADRLICGGSSGGNCAMTAAWMRPDLFSHVITFLASFAQIPGGNPYPELIPATPPKPFKFWSSPSAPPDQPCGSVRVLQKTGFEREAGIEREREAMTLYRRPLTQDEAV